MVSKFGREGDVLNNLNTFDWKHVCPCLAKGREFQVCSCGDLQGLVVANSPKVCAAYWQNSSVGLKPEDPAVCKLWLPRDSTISNHLCLTVRALCSSLGRGCILLVDDSDSKHNWAGSIVLLFLPVVVRAEAVV